MRIFARLGKSSQGWANLRKAGQIFARLGVIDFFFLCEQKSMTYIVGNAY